MPTIDAARAFAQDVMCVDDEAGLADLLHAVCDRLGCSWFALSHHIDFLAAPEKGIRLHNYPAEWARWFDDNRLGLSDPVHRASQRRMAAFLWRDMAGFAAQRPQDEEILAAAQRHGIGDGLTVPAHLPGEAHGSVSFAWLPGVAARPDALQFAQMIGGYAFEAARQLTHPELSDRNPRLTDRQRECVIWAARGKSAWEIATILGLSPETVNEHLRNARGRYDAHGRITLTIRALFGGDISFGDLAGH